jgi:uncharacterized membrane protein
MSRKPSVVSKTQKSKGKTESQVKTTSVKTASQVKSQAHPRHLNWLERHVPTLLIGSGALGLFASFMLAIEEFHHLKHPDAPLNCDLNPIVSCGPAMDVWQGHALLGIPNQFLGIITFTVMLTMGMALLAGARFKRWFWLGLQAGMFAGFVFVTWFIYQSIWVLEHLCPYCMVTWVATIVGFWYIFLYGPPCRNTLDCKAAGTRLPCLSRSTMPTS